MSQITVSGPVRVTSEKTGKVVTSAVKLRKLNKLVSKDSCVNYLDTELSELDLQGGEIRFSFDASSGETSVLTVYQSSKKLNKKQLKLLKEETVGQWTDGIGEGEFDDFQSSSGLVLDLYPDKKLVTIEQLDAPAGTAKPARRKIFTAITKGDVAGVEQALRDSEDIEGRKEGYTPLHVALREGQVEVTRCLLSHGADVHAVDSHDHGTLLTIAIIRDEFVSDETATELAKLLVEAGADVHRINSSGYYAMEMALSRSKKKLAAYLQSQGARLFDVQIEVRTSDGKPFASEGALGYKGCDEARCVETDRQGFIKEKGFAPGTLRLILDESPDEEFELMLDKEGVLSPSVLVVS